jgi:hypothetical protein
VVGGFGAYVFVDHGGTWTQQAQLLPSDRIATTIGTAVAMSGLTIVATSIPSALNTFGAAYVFVPSPAAASADPAAGAWGPVRHGS